MRTRRICITEVDRQRLAQQLRSGLWRRCREPEHLRALEDGLEHARVVAPENVPPDVVTMRSRVQVQDVDSGRDAVLTVAFPFEADSAQGRVSVLAPIGAALLGSRAGETVRWKTGEGVQRLRIERVLYQPEAAGDYER
jgi:regulator of nucleoside diphosphate kinase